MVSRNRRFRVERPLADRVNGEFGLREEGLR